MVEDPISYHKDVYLTQERSVGMKIEQKKNAFSASLFAGLLFVGVASGAPSVKIEKVEQRWPWNNKVDITYSITDGQDVSKGKYYSLIFTANIDGTEHTIDGVHDVGASAATGSHIVTWTAPSGIKTENFSVSAAMYTATVPSGNDYMIIDLASGQITYEGLLATQEQSNERYNVDTYKGDKLVLRKVPAGGSYPTGHSSYSSVNSPKVWKTDRDYYIGIFPVTRTQYTNLGLADPSTSNNPYGDSPLAYRPIGDISWIDLRTDISPSDQIPAVTTSGTGTFFQRLNFVTKNKYGFDLPTEVMSEIAERAGATTHFHWGDEISGDYSRYFVSRRDLADNTQQKYLMPVGSRLPNGWGIYDTVGNCYEFLLDDASRINLADAPDPWTPADDGIARRMYANYGICNQGVANTWRLSNRQKTKTDDISHMAPSVETTKKDWVYGFRVAYIVK